MRIAIVDDDAADRRTLHGRLEVQLAGTAYTQIFPNTKTAGNFSPKLHRNLSPLCSWIFT